MLEMSFVRQDADLWSGYSFKDIIGLSYSLQEKLDGGFVECV